MKKTKEDAFERYEKLPPTYHTDPRWKEVKELRKPGPNQDILRSNGLVFNIRSDYGFE